MREEIFSFHSSYLDSSEQITSKRIIYYDSVEHFVLVCLYREMFELHKTSVKLIYSAHLVFVGRHLGNTVTAKLILF